MKIVALNRRDFLRSSALVTGGLLLGFESPVAAKVQSTSSQLGPFLQMTNQGKIRLGVPVVEMGQGIYTSLAMSVVEELEMTLDQVEDIQTIFHPAFKNPIVSYMTNNQLQLQMTGGSRLEFMQMFWVREESMTSRRHPILTNWQKVVCSLKMLLLMHPPVPRAEVLYFRAETFGRRAGEPF